MEDGVLYWTNDLGIENPEPASIAGPKGDTGERGTDGVSATHSWDGTVLTVTSASGTSSVDLKGERGERGETGPQGERGSDGTGLTIKGTYNTTEELEAAHPTGIAGDGYLIDGALFVWSDEDDRWVNVGQVQGPAGEKGDTGAEGAPGADGTSPVITVEENSDGYDVTITDVNGEQVISLLHGANGNDGTSVTHRWEGTVLTVSSASGTTSADLRGEKGDAGEPGPRGEKGADGVMTFEDLTAEQKETLKGDKGDTGEKGADGVSATHSFVGTILKMTSASGTTVVDLKGDKGDQGIQGPKGDTGESGNDGMSPVVTVSTISGGHSVSIQDATGTKSFDILDGLTELDDTVTTAGTKAVTGAAVARYVADQIAAIADYNTIAF